MRWSRSTARVLLLAGVVVIGCRPEPEASAGPRAPEPVAGTPSHELGQALYKQEDYPAAAWVFERVIEGAQGEDRAHAEFWLGKSYFQLDDFERATQVFLAIVRAQGHEHRMVAFAWLVTLRKEQPDDGELLRAIGDEGEVLLVEESLTAMRDPILIALGEHRLRTGRPADAVMLLQQVPEASPSYGEAQLFAGLAAERLGRRAEAIDRLFVAATRGAPTRRERRKGQVDPYEERVRQRATRELERLGAAPS
jgi:Flp pilus assembly protein TadD